MTQRTRRSCRRVGGCVLSFVIAAPQKLASAASGLAGLGSTVSAAGSAAAASTTGLAARGR
nr:PE domain-containing protein [Mycobacterium simiae]